MFECIVIFSHKIITFNQIFHPFDRRISKSTGKNHSFNATFLLDYSQHQIHLFFVPFSMFFSGSHD
jgi:hypothetical protein